MKLFLTTIIFTTLANLATAAELSPVGVWLTEDKDAKIEVYKNGETLEGKVVWMKDPNEKDGKPKLDTKNPDENLKTRPILNLVLVKDFKKDSEENKWSGGTIYDAKSGKTYKAWMKMVDEKNMKLRGYVGVSLLGRTTEWTRDSL